MVWLQDVVCAAISGWLLVVAQAVTDYSIVHLCALLPFFRRVLVVEARRAVAMSLVLATAFVVVSADRTGSVLHVCVVELLVLNLLFALYGLALGRARSVFGATPLLLIFLWLPLEVSQNHLETLTAPLRFGFHFGDRAEVFFSLPNAALVIALAVALYALLLTIACCLIVLTCTRFRGRDRNQRRGWRADWMPALVRRRYELPDWRSPPGELAMEG